MPSSTTAPPQAAPQYDPDSCRNTLFGALLCAARRHGAGKQILEDIERQPMSYGRLILAALVLGKRLAEDTQRGETVGVLLPNVAGLAATIFGLNAYGRVPALLNFSAGAKNLSSALRTGLIATIITSRRFIATAKLQDVIDALAATQGRPGHKTRIIYLEDLRKTIGTKDRITGLMKSKFAARVHARHALGPDDPAMVLFTSGTEGEPKGVVLSNANIVANSSQIFAHAAGMFTPADTVLNPLPMFHSFGLTAATFMPLLNGLKVVLYPSPLHYKQVPKLICATRATIMFATDTFAQGYARMASDGDLDSIRYVVCGAEKVKATTRKLWHKAGSVLLEGYGATECAPVIACNTPRAGRDGTVGPLLPGIEVRLEPVAGIAEGGRLLVKGPNVMSGYMLSKSPGKVIPPDDGWHDTGDIVTIDDDGLMAISGRAKRFAKLGGEMISLAAVETMVAALWPDWNHVVLSAPDPKKGEQLVLLTDNPTAQRGELHSAAKAAGYPELWTPRKILSVAEIPILGSGKVDFQAANELACRAAK